MTYEELIEEERLRQQTNIELIASENFPSKRVLDACGSCLTAKYAEGYSGKRYYGGCKWIDEIETKAIKDVCTLFNCKYANVQPHCGSSANQAVYRALLKQGDTVLGMDLGAGGHLTHGHRMSFSGQDYNIISYGVDNNGIIDLNNVRELVFEYKPRMIIVGASSYSRTIDYSKFRDIVNDYNREILEQCKKEVPGTLSEINDELDKLYSERKLYMMVDMAHVAGLVAAGVHPNPCEYADVVTSTTHKTLRGPRGGIILWNDEAFTKKINSAVFPGIQGGPLEHIIAAKGICFEEANTDEFKNYAKQVVNNSKIFAEELKLNGAKIISDGTDNHMFVLDTYSTYGLTGKEVETFLDKVNITLNKNQIPNDTLPPLKSSGVRIGTAAMTTKGWQEQHFVLLADLIDRMLKDSTREESIDTYKKAIQELIDLVRINKEN